jgi:hypothetical protein
MIKRNTRFFSTRLFITQLWYAFDLSQYRKSTKAQDTSSTPPLPIPQVTATHPTYPTKQITKNKKQKTKLTL